MFDHQLGLGCLRLVFVSGFMVLDGFEVLGRFVVLGSASLQLEQALSRESVDKRRQNQGVYTNQTQGSESPSYQR